MRIYAPVGTLLMFDLDLVFLIDAFLLFKDSR